MNIFFKRSAILIAVFFTLLIVLTTLLPLVLPNVVSAQADKRGIALIINNLDISWLKGRIDLEGIEFGAKEQQSRATVTNVTVDMDMTSLFSGDMFIEDFRLEKAWLPMSLRDDIPYLAGIDLASFSDEKPDSKDSEVSQDQPLVWRLESLVLKDMTAEIDINDDLLPLKLHQLSIGVVDSRQPALETPVTLNLAVNDALLKMDAKTSNLLNNPTINGHFSLTDIEVDPWLSLSNALGISLPQSISGAEGNIAVRAHVDIAVNESHASAVIEDLAVSMADIKIPALSEGLSLAADTTFTVSQLSYEPEQFTLRDLTVRAESIEIIEGSVEPAAKIQLSELEASVDGFGQPEKVSEVTLQSNVGDYGSIILEGNMSLSPPGLTPNSSGEAGNKVNAMATVKVKQLDLLPFSGFSKQYLGRHIDSGALTLDMDIKIEEDNLNSLVEMSAHQFYLGGDYGVENSTFLDELGMPVNTILSLLRDSNDTISLKVPLKGDLNNPQVRIGGIINKALLSATQSMLITQFGPLAAISVASKTLDFADSLKLKPILFSPSSTDIEGSEFAKLEVLTELLQKRPSLTMKTCGYAVSTDLDEDRLSLAEKRADVVKKALINIGAEAGQLIACAAKLDEEEGAEPRVVLSF